MTFFRYCQVLYLLARHGLRAEAVKDSTLRNDGICRGVHHYQIIARRQDFEAPLPHGVAVCGLPTSSHRTPAFRPTSMGIFIRQEPFAASCALLGSPYFRNACAMQRPVSSAISKSHKRPLFKIPTLRISTHAHA